MPQPIKFPLGKVLFAVVGVILLAELWLVAFFLPGKAQEEWRTTRAELMAKGEKLTLADFVPGPIPDEDNFFADPIWRELSDRVPVERKGMITHKSRMPEEEWQLRVLKRPFSEVERQSLEAEFPEFQNVDWATDRLKVARSVWEKPSKASEDLPRAARFVFEAFAAVEPLIGRLRELGKRPDALFPIAYGDGVEMRLEHVAYLLTVAQWLDVHASAALAVGRVETARDDVRLIFRLAETLKRESVLISALVQANLTKMGARVIDEGIKLHAWSESELLEFDRMLAPIDLPPRLAGALRSDRASIVETIMPLIGRAGPELLTEFVGSSKSWSSPPWLNPMFWLYQTYWMPGDQSFCCRVIQSWVEPLDAASHLGMRASLYPNTIQDYLAAHPSIWDKMPKMLSILSLPSLHGAFVVVAGVQNRVFQTRVAMALERYRMKRGHYPDALDPLVPEFLNVMPLDVITLRPFSYRKIGADKFALWSVGWNEIDEEGKADRQVSKGDWVWGG